MSEKILAIETTGQTCSVALTNGEEITSEITIHIGNRHDELLSHIIKQIVDFDKLSMDNIDAVAVSSGPGSFTGLRIGGSVAIGLSFSGTPKLISVPTLSAIAHNSIDYAKLSNSNRIISTMPSHKNILYYQIFDNSANPLSEIEFTEREDIVDIFRSEDLITGPGVKIIQEEYNKKLSTLTAEAIAKYAHKLYINKEFTDSSEYEPMYIQKFKPKTKNKKLNI